MSNKNTRYVLIIFFAVLILGFLTVYKYMQDKHLNVNLEVIGEPGHTVGPFKLVNQNGDTLTDKDVQGKIRIVEFFFTTCKGICPKMNENMYKVYQEFKNEKDILILSHTVHPEVDTPAQLKRYSEKFEASAQRWQFLTGTKKDIYALAIYDYLLKAGDSTAKVLPDFIHDNHFVLVDKQNRLRGKYYDGTDEGDVNQLIGDIKILLSKEK